MVTLNEEMIELHKTKNGAWTRKQIEALGLVWPPKNGWKKALIGKSVTDKQFKEFIEGKEKFVKSTRKTHKVIKKIKDREEALLWLIDQYGSEELKMLAKEVR